MPLTFGNRPSTKIWNVLFNGKELTAINLNDENVWQHYLNFEETTSYLDGTFYTVTSNTANAGTPSPLIIPSTFNGMLVKRIGTDAFKDETNITSIKIPSSIVSIYRNAFSRTDNLKDVYIEDLSAWCKISFSNDWANPLYWGKGNLYLNNNLIEDLTIPDDNDVTSIPSYAFCCCLSLKSVSIPDNKRSLGNQAFYSCQNIKSVTFGNNVTSIGGSAFWDCNKLESINIPNSVTSLGSEAFYSCDNLSSVTLSTSLTSIQKKTFQDCKSLTSVVIPDSVTSIGDYAFSGCTSLASVTIGDGVTEIGGWAFQGCTNLKSITIPASVTSIDYGAFKGCINLESITFAGENITSISAAAFEGCSKLTSITIPNSVTSLGSGLLAGCSALEELTIPFVGDSSAKKAGSKHQYPFGYIFGTKAFDYATETAQSYYAGSLTSTTTEKYYIPDSLTFVTVTGGQILSGAFENCIYIKQVVLPTTAKSIGSSAFYMCTNLIAITIPNSVTSIGGHAFYGCESLYAVDIGDIEAWCKIHFYNESSNPLYYGKELMLNGEPVTDLVIPDTITQILPYTFINCSTLQTVRMPDNLYKVSKYSFYSCTNLQGFNIPNNSDFIIEEYAIKNLKDFNNFTTAYGSWVAYPKCPDESHSIDGTVLRTRDQAGYYGFAGSNSSMTTGEWLSILFNDEYSCISSDPNWNFDHSETGHSFIWTIKFN